MDSVSVRMYRQGLGDCFLLTVTMGGTARHVLIDCGLLLGSPDADATMQAVAADIRDTTGGHLDVLAATHEHWDHISGFVQASQIFSSLTVDEVWLAWTEDPRDADAQKLRGDRHRAVQALAGAAHALQLNGSDQAEQLLGVLGFYGDVGSSGEMGLAGRTTTAQSMQWLRERPTVRYLRPGQFRDALGLRVFVLGPPTDPRWIRRNDPSAAGGEVYPSKDDGSGKDDGQTEGFLVAAQALARAADPDASTVAVAPGLQPFDAFFRLDVSRVADTPPIQEYLAPSQDWRRIDQDWLGAADVLALDLDSSTNNTSLVLAFEIGDGSVLLFPGDAQVGNWLSWQDVTWTTPEGPVTGPQLLARTRLYKVGHHGSHNATLRAKGLELMTRPDLVAMLPVNRAAAEKHKWNMPLPSLLRALETMTKGRILDAERGLPPTRPDGLSVDQWKDFVAHTTLSDLWVEHTVTWKPRQ